MFRGSLKARLLVRSAAATAVILTAAAVSVYFGVRASLLEEFDSALTSSAHAVAALIEQDGNHIRTDEAARDLEEFRRERNPEVFAAWTDDGTLVGVSHALKDRPPPAPPTMGIEKIVDQPLFDGSNGRAVAIQFFPHTEDQSPASPPTPKRVTLLVMRHRHSLDERLKRLMAVLFTVTLAATGAGALTMWLVVRNGLRPLQSLASRIESIGRRSLDERIELTGAPLELHVVVERLNQLLDRVKQTVLNERRFNGDVAHELRTPLAGLQATIEVCISRRRIPAEYERSLARCMEIVGTLRRLVDDLLMLARADAGEISAKREPFELCELVKSRWANVEAIAQSRGLQVSIHCEAALHGCSDQGLLGIVLGNLLENAVAHVNDGGWVRIDAAEKDGQAVIRIANSGCRVMDPEEIERATDRFWRADTSRTGDGAHCGLGLAICREVASVLGVGMTLAASSDGVFTATVAVPLATEQPKRQQLLQVETR